jgi:hypothetical protein
MSTPTPTQEHLDVEVDIERIKNLFDRTSSGAFHLNVGLCREKGNKFELFVQQAHGTVRFLQHTRQEGMNLISQILDCEENKMVLDERKNQGNILVWRFW